MSFYIVGVFIVGYSKTSTIFVKHEIYKDKYMHVNVLTPKSDNILFIRAHNTSIDLSFKCRVYFFDFGPVSESFRQLSIYSICE